MVGRVINLDKTGVSLGGTPVLHGLDLTLEEGQVMGVVGPNGSGKTTLLRLIATLVAPSSGAGEVLGSALGTSEVYEIRGDIGLISHQPAVIPELTLEENLVHSIRLVGADEARVKNALRVVGLDGAGSRRGTDSSFGMMRRVEVARLLITQPRLLLLDEALAGLDEEAQELIGALVQRTTSDGGAAVLVSHDVALLRRHGPSIQRLASGTLEAIS